MAKIIDGEQVRCPNCGASDVGTLEEIRGCAGVLSWTLDDDGHVTGVDDWTGDTEMFWDTSTTDGAYCTSCGWGGEFSDLVVSFDGEKEE